MAKYRTKLLTAKKLEELGACYPGLAWFRKKFPKGVKLSNDAEEMTLLVANLGDGGNSFLKWLLDQSNTHCDLYFTSYIYDCDFTQDTAICCAGPFFSDLLDLI